MDKNMMSPGGVKSGLAMSPPLIPMDENEESEQQYDRSQMSPMHPPRPLVINEEEGDEGADGKVESKLFSPMLHMQKDGEEGDGEPAEDIKAPVLDDHQDEDTDDNDEYDDDPTDDKDDDDKLVGDDESSQGSYDEEDEFNPYVFIKSLPLYDLVAPLRPPVALPPKSKDAPPISLVLDLDETLVHCTVEPVEDADLVFPVDFHGMTYQVHVRLRPYLFEFLEKIKDKYEVIVFTASQKIYANELLNLIDPGMLLRKLAFSYTSFLSHTLYLFHSPTEGKYIKHRMYRESCLAVEGNFLKDLNVLGRDLSKAVLVDNSPHAFGYQVDNGIPIESWFDDPKDTELRKLERFLRTLHGVKDCRKVVRKTFQTHRLVEES
jgi:CTD small phosphatase-like protein 2